MIENAQKTPRKPLRAQGLGICKLWGTQAHKHKNAGPADALFPWKLAGARTHCCGSGTAFSRRRLISLETSGSADPAGPAVRRARRCIQAPRAGTSRPLSGRGLAVVDAPRPSSQHRTASVRDAPCARGAARRFFTIFSLSHFESRRFSSVLAIIACRL